MTLLIALFARWGVPESVRRPLALVTTVLAVAALLGLLWTWWLRGHDKAKIAEYEGAVQQAVATASASASAAAIETTEQSKAKTEQGNDDARKAAAGSDDPLRDGLGSLRSGQGPQRSGPR